jgi:tape measure domain-containing protein
MARREVDLRVRAKADEAERALESVTQALNEFKAAQKGIVSQQGDTKSSFTDLGVAISKLDTAMRSFDDRFSGKVEKASEKAALLTASVEKTSASLKESQKAFAAAEKAATRAADSLAKTTAKYDAVRKAQQADTEALKKATAARDEAAGRQARYASEIEKSSERIAKSADGINRYRQRIVELKNQLKEKPQNINLGNSLETAERQLAKFNEQNRQARTDLRAAQAGYDRATVSVGKYGAAVTKAEVAVRNSDRSVKRVATSLDAWKTKAKDTSREQNALAGEVEKTTARLARETVELDRTKASLADVSSELAQAQGQFAQFSKQGFQGLRLDIGNQVRTVREAREVFAQLTDTANRMAAEIGRAGVPTLQMAYDFERVKEQAREAKQELIEQTNTLGLLRQAYNQSGQSADKLVATQAKFAAVHQQSEAALRGIATESARAKTELNGVYAGFAKVAGARIPNQTQPLREEVTLLERLRRLWAALAGEKRTALSLTQRLRGEVLSLVAAYGGVFAVVDVLKRTVGAYQQLEGAQSRLNVAVGGDTQKSAAELDFVRRTAERLGIEFGYLATEYSKFAIATQGTNLEGEKTRKIFTSVAEAARVNRASNEELKGVFTALTQIVSKGAVQMEELRQQLGDRLPGALQIMADGLGVTTAELIKMMEQGEVTSDALIPFAEELDKRFGPGLAEALESVTTAIGRMRNAAFQALLTFGRGGFLDSFEELANTITATLESADFQTFLGNLSVVFAALTKVVTAAIANFRLLFVAVTALVSVRILPWVLALAGGFQKAIASGVAAFTLSIEAAGKASAVAGGRMAGATAGVLAFSTALKSLLATTGIGLVFVAATSALAYWASEADAATEALETHEKILDQVKNAYDAVGGSVEDWRAKLDDLTVTEARRNLLDLSDSLQDAKDDFEGVASLFRENIFGQIGLGEQPVVRKFLEDAKALYDSFADGTISSSKFVDELDKLIDANREASPRVVQLGEEILGAAKEMDRMAQAVQTAEDIITALTGSGEEAAAAIRRLNGESEKSAVSTDALGTAMDGLKEAVAALVESAPKAKTETEQIAEFAYQLERHYQEALKAARALPDAIMRAAAEQAILNERAAGLAALWETNQGIIDSGFGGGLVDRIIGVESGGNASARNPNSSATGLGQFIESTWLRMFKQYFPDRAAGMTDAMILALREDAELSRKMVELYLRENAEHLQRAGVAITDANLYLAHFLGPGGASALINSAPGTLANSVLGADQVSANASILDGKTREEVIAWAQQKVGISNEELSVNERLLEIDQERADAIIKGADAAIKRAEEAAQQTDERIADNDFEISQQERIAAGLERQAAIEEAIREAKKENAAITDEELAKIAEQAGRLHDLEQSNKNILTTKEKAKEAEEAVNNLLQIRQALMEQVQIATEAGDTALTTELKAKIAEVNASLESAIANAIAMWEAVGGPEADAAIAKLQTAALEAEHFNLGAQDSYFSWKKVGDLLLGGLGDAVSTFAQTLAETGNVFESIRQAFLKFASDFLIQIGRMIVQQAIFNALKGTGLGNFLGIGVAHRGDVVGRSSGKNARRKVSPSVFFGAQRFHGGGLPGLRPDEVPIIAKKGEEVLSETDPRNILNGGGTGESRQPVVNLRNINTFDPAAALQAALDTPEGEKAIINFMGSRSGKVRGALNS